MGTTTDSGIPSRDNGSGMAVGTTRARRRLPAWLDARNVVWDVAVGLLQRVTGSQRGEKLEFMIGASVRDLVSEKGRQVRDEVEALAQSVMRTGSYQAKDEANRAVRAVIDALGDRVPPDLLMKLSEHLPRTEAARLRRVVSLQRRSKKKRGLNQPVSVGGGSKPA